MPSRKTRRCLGELSRALFEQSKPRVREPVGSLSCIPVKAIAVTLRIHLRVHRSLERYQPITAVVSNDFVPILCKRSTSTSA